MYFSSLRTPDQLLTVFLMSSLLWPKDFDSPETDDANCHTLKAYIPDQRVTLPVKALLDTVITTSSDGNSQVFRAELRIVAAGGLTDHDYGGDVVCKVAYDGLEVVHSEESTRASAMSEVCPEKEGHAAIYIYSAKADNYAGPPSHRRRLLNQIQQHRRRRLQHPQDQRFVEFMLKLCLNVALLTCCRSCR